MIVDEAQNLAPHEVKTIASRVREGTRLVVTGDATQIDNPYLNSSSNGSVIWWTGSRASRSSGM